MTKANARPNGASAGTKSFSRDGRKSTGRTTTKAAGSGFPKDEQFQILARNVQQAEGISLGQSRTAPLATGARVWMRQRNCRHLGLLTAQAGTWGLDRIAWRRSRVSKTSTGRTTLKDSQNLTPHPSIVEACGIVPEECRRYCHATGLHRQAAGPGQSCDQAGGRDHLVGSRCR